MVGYLFRINLNENCLFVVSLSLKVLVFYLKLFVMIEDIGLVYEVINKVFVFKFFLLLRFLIGLILEIKGC